MAPVQIDSVIQANAARWPQMIIDFDALAPLNQVAARLIGNKARYQTLFSATNVPWPVIAVIHERECSQNWNLSIAQGDPWSAVSVHVPAGRGPFTSWEDAATDALTQCGTPVPSQWQHWDTIEGVLTRLEMYNGLGYAMHGAPSPYVWSRTSVYVSGKYTSDGSFNAAVVDSQEGCAPLLACMMGQDPSILADFAWMAPPAQPSLTGPDGVVHDTGWLQQTLNQLHANPQLKVDGGWGPNTSAALSNFQQSAGLGPSGRYDLATLQSLESALANLALAPS